MYKIIQFGLVVLILKSYKNK